MRGGVHPSAADARMRGGVHPLAADWGKAEPRPRLLALAAASGLQLGMHTAPRTSAAHAVESDGPFGPDLQLQIRMLPFQFIDALQHRSSR